MELPFGLANITGLRHLNIAGRDGLTRLPAGLGNLAQLQTSSLYTVGKGIGESITEISCLNLRGELRIRCLENIRDKEEAILANLRAKKYVELLRFQWGSGNEEKIVKLATARFAEKLMVHQDHYRGIMTLSWSVSLSVFIHM